MSLISRFSGWLGRSTEKSLPASAPISLNDPAIRQLFTVGYPAPFDRFAPGRVVSDTEALAIPAVYAAVRAISEDFAKLPMYVERRVSGGVWVRDHDHPVNRILRAPNQTHTPFDMKALIGGEYALRNNAYAVVLRNDDGSPRGIVPVPGTLVQPFVDDYGEMVYAVTHEMVNGRIQKTVRAENMIHVRGYSLNGYVGISPLALLPGMFGVTTAAQAHGEALFMNGAQIGGILTVAGELSVEGKIDLGKSFKQQFAGVGNAHGIPVLEEGTTFTKTALTSDEAQFLETRMFQIEEIARAFRVPKHKIGDLRDANNNNLEQEEARYDNETIAPLVDRVVQQMNEKLFFDKEFDHYRIVFDRDAIRRADYQTRMAAGAMAINNGIKNRNEVRADEGLPPVPGGDVFVFSANTIADADQNGTPDTPTATPPSPETIIDADQ